MFETHGLVLERQNKRGGDGDRVYNYESLRILAGKADVLTVKFDPTVYEGPIPNEGESVHLAVRVTAFSGRNGASLSVQALRPLDAGNRKAA